MGQCVLQQFGYIDLSIAKNAFRMFRATATAAAFERRNILLYETASHTAAAVSKEVYIYCKDVLTA